MSSRRILRSNKSANCVKRHRQHNCWAGNRRNLAIAPTIGVNECNDDISTTTDLPVLLRPPGIKPDTALLAAVRELDGARTTGIVGIGHPKISQGSSSPFWGFDVLGVGERDLGAVRGPYRVRSCPLLMHVHKWPSAAPVGVHFPDISLNGNS